MISEIVVGLVTGAVSSFAVAVLFYRIGRDDVKAAHRLVELDSVLFRLAQLAPKRWKSERDGDGVDDTNHWFLCTAGIMRDTGFECGERLLRAIADEMLQVCCPPSQRPAREMTDKEASELKDQWAERIHALRSTLPRSLLDRIWRTSDGCY